MFRCDDGLTCPSGFRCNPERYCVALIDAAADAPPACGKIELFQDNFDDGGIGAPWMPVMSGGGSVMETSGEARIVLNPSMGFGAYRSIDRADLTSSHVYITVIRVSGGTTQTYLRVAADGDNSLEIVVENNVISFKQGSMTLGFTGYDNTTH